MLFHEIDRWFEQTPVQNPTNVLIVLLTRKCQQISIPFVHNLLSQKKYPYPITPFFSRLLSLRKWTKSSYFISTQFNLGHILTIEWVVHKTFIYFWLVYSTSQVQGGFWMVHICFVTRYNIHNVHMYLCIHFFTHNNQQLHFRTCKFFLPIFLSGNFFCNVTNVYI